jgi:hypothetical protein
MSKKFLDPQVYFFELATTNKTPVVYPRNKDATETVYRHYRDQQVH